MQQFWYAARCDSDREDVVLSDVRRKRDVYPQLDAAHPGLEGLTEHIKAGLYRITFGDPAAGGVEYLVANATQARKRRWIL